MGIPVFTVCKNISLGASGVPPLHQLCNVESSFSGL